MSDSRFLQRVAIAVAIASWGAGPAQAATLVPDVNFGGSDGWRAPYEVLTGDPVDTIVPDNNAVPSYRFLGNALVGAPTTPVNAGNLERGLAYNPTTGHLVLVSRNGAATDPTVRILDGATGVDIGSLNLGTDIITGGLFTKNMVGVADDGAIYISNLTTAAPANGNFKVYRWANESATPTVAYDGAPLAGARLGDTFDVLGSGAETRLVAGYSNGPAVAGNNSFAIFDTNDGLTYSATHVDLAVDPVAEPPVTLPTAGEFRLGITFQDSDTVLGTSTFNPVHQVNVAGANGTVTANIATEGAGLRPMDFAVVQGKPLLAIVEATPDQGTVNRARLFVYDISDPSLPLIERKVGEATALPAAPEGSPGQFVNGNSVGQVKFGAINGNVATIYAMSTNNGIQAFTLTLDLPADDNANFDGDADVDGADFLTWQANFDLQDTATLATGDANGDLDVNDADFAVWKAQFGDTGLATAAATGVPEPTASLLSLMALVGLAARRRRV